MIEINLLLIFMIAAALIAIHVKDLLSSVIGIGAVGIGLSMAFLVLKAPDLAMMQLVVEVLSLIILIRATIRKDLPFSASGRWVFNTVSAITFIAAFLGFAYVAFANIHAFGNPAAGLSKEYYSHLKAASGDRNIVDYIMMNYRIVDTLGEATVLLAAVIGVLAIARKVWRREDVK